MRITWTTPSVRFDAISFTSEIIDGRAGPMRTVYTCPRCALEVMFSRADFEQRARRRISNLSLKTAICFHLSALPRRLPANCFLDWQCPKCQLAVRAYVDFRVGGRHGEWGSDIVAVVEAG